MMAATNAGFGKTAEHPSLSSAGLKAISTDIFAHLLERQVPQQAQFNALFATAVGAARFPFGSKRATYIGWIFQLSSRLGFGPDTGASAVVLMDRTLLVLGRACPRLPEDGSCNLASPESVYCVCPSLCCSVVINIFGFLLFLFPSDFHRYNIRVLVLDFFFFGLGAFFYYSYLSSRPIRNWTYVRGLLVDHCKDGREGSRHSNINVLDRGLRDN